MRLQSAEELFAESHVSKEKSHVISDTALFVSASSCLVHRQWFIHVRFVEEFGIAVQRTL